VVVSRFRIPYLSSSGLLDNGSLSDDLLRRGGLDLGTGPGMGLGDRDGVAVVGLVGRAPEVEKGVDCVEKEGVVATTDGVENAGVVAKNDLIVVEEDVVDCLAVSIPGVGIDGSGSGRSCCSDGGELMKFCLDFTTPEEFCDVTTKR